MSVIGKPLPRVDGRAKVTGEATYAAEFHPPGMVWGVPVQATIAHGRILRIETDAALGVPGVLRVLTHENMPVLPWGEHRAQVDPNTGGHVRVLNTDRVLHQGQHVALVVGETPEAADAGRRLVRVHYAAEPGITDIEEAARSARLMREDEQDAQAGPPITTRGEPEAAFGRAPVTVDEAYVMPRQSQNPMEPHTCTAFWDGDELTVWDKTQWTQNTAEALATAFGIDKSKVHVVCPFVGGAFGSALRVWTHTFLAAMAAREVGRPVKIELSRRETYNNCGARPWTRQRLRIGANADGTLAAILHEMIGETSTHETYVEATPRPVRALYACANVETQYRVAERFIGTPNAMRAPGETTGLYALECALDELSYRLGIDPVELRLRNTVDHDQFKKLPFSSNAHAECLRFGAERFGWSARPREPGTLRDGRLLVGRGMASAFYPTNISPAQARVRLTRDGVVDVMTAASDMGPGTWTSLTQVAAGVLGIPVERVNLAIGFSDLPMAPVHGGSMTMASVGNAVHQACADLKAEVQRLTGANDILSVAARLGTDIEVTGKFSPGDLTEHYAPAAFGATFVEVAVDPDTGETRVRRALGAYGAGNIVNPRLARSQCIGGFIMGIGQALMERTEVDDRTGRVVNANLAEYLVPVLADTPELEVHFVPEHDPHLGPLGAKGLGEIALCGIGPAIANAVFHATGRRVRDLPITPDRLV